MPHALSTLLRNEALIPLASSSLVARGSMSIAYILTHDGGKNGVVVIGRTRPKHSARPLRGNPETRNGGNYHAGQQLHGVATSPWLKACGRKKTLEDAQRSAEMAKRSSRMNAHRDDDNWPTDSETALRIGTVLPSPNSNTFSGNTRISL